MTPTPKPARADLAPEALAKEVTPAMRLAGATLLYRQGDYRLPEELAEAIYCAMAALAHRPAPDLLALAAKWRARSDAIRSPVGATEVRSASDNAQRDTLDHCIEELEALAAEGARDG